ncbi:MAG TPA: hypothetical protein VMZ31_01325 [Phycisphaerae bacterium]|nr:hypothetical protein [Phycisphaerae bacterium]
MAQSRWVAVFATVATFGAAASPAQAMFFRDVARALQYAGFTVEGQRNILTDGAVVNISQRFFGQPLNFGQTELTPNGQLRAQVGWDRRPIPALQFFMDTGNAPLNYELRRNFGMQDFLATGELQLSIGTEFNALGFYDTIVGINNTGTFETEGLFGENSGHMDFDVGPINISGNVVADVLAAVFDALALGEDNPFREFSLRSTREKNGIDPEQIAQIEAALAAGEQITGEQASLLATDSVIQGLFGLGDPQDGALQFVDSENPQSDAAGVPMTTPEPITALLVVAGLVGIVGRRR